MFLDQIKAPKIGGVVHVCDDKPLFSQLYNGIERIIPCTVCGKSRYDNVHPLTNAYALADCLNPQNMGVPQYKDSMGYSQFAGELAAEYIERHKPKEIETLWQRIKGWFI